MRDVLHPKLLEPIDNELCPFSRDLIFNEAELFDAIDFLFDRL